MMPIYARITSVAIGQRKADIYIDLKNEDILCCFYGKQFNANQFSLAHTYV